jgi:hypothetical protein
VHNNTKKLLSARHRTHIATTAWLFLLAILLPACATRPYEGSDVNAASFISRAVIKENGELTVTAAVPDATETEALTGLDLYDQGIQPVWLKVENNGDTVARVATWSIDRDYFSPIEVAYMNRKQFSSQGYRDMERWFHENGLPREIPPGETRSGLVFTHLRPGTKGFNLNIFSNRTAYDFTFFVPLPGFVPDFMKVDFANLYSEQEIRDLDKNRLRTVLEQELGCCVTDDTGKLQGGPINVVMVGSGVSVRRSMLRGGWLETSADEGVAVKERTQHFLGRHPDAIFSQLREDGNERINLHLWMAPWRVDAEPVWVGQVYYFTEEKSLLGALGYDQEKSSDLRSFFVRESVTADIDSAQRFLFQNLWYNGSLKEAGFVGGVGEVSVDNPREGFGGVAYFTDGFRMVVFLSETPVAMDEGRFIYVDSTQRVIRRRLEQR